MTFALVALILIGGQVEAFEIDHGLTYEDCKRAVEVVDVITTPLVCELER